MPTNKKGPLILAGVAVLALVLGGYFYFLAEPDAPAIDAAREVSGVLPEIPTNPAEKVPEVNPVDRANPFKYSNPLR